MLLIILRVVYLLVCAGAILTYINPEEVEGVPVLLPKVINDNRLAAFFGLLLLSQVVTMVDLLIRRKRIEVISAIYFGVLVGVLLAYLMIQALSPVVRPPYDGLATMMTLLILPYLCVSLLLQTKDDFRFVIPYVEFAKQIRGYKVTLLDTSVIIDGRILDIAETRVLQGPLIVPKFVLHELQAVADSQDKLKRARGRRGLDVLSKLQESTSLEVSIEDTPVEGVGVDQMLVTLAQQMQARVMTNDYNLNKIANLRGVEVVNLNDLAKAMRPTVLPGEALRVKIIRPGESANQGVGYLEDGTMVVVEHARQHVGEEIAVQVTSTLQTSAGRMIFGRASETRPAIGSSGSTSISDHPRGGHANPRSNPHENTNPGAFVSPQEPKRAAASGGASGGRIVNGASHR
ncbi:MAG: TRAM domain-containing protein [Planctomycetaceae bacterium]|nr:TRAM domain-containing protein [Planctomycetaceae bacterium]